MSTSWERENVTMSRSFLELDDEDPGLGLLLTSPTPQTPEREWQWMLAQGTTVIVSGELEGMDQADAEAAALEAARTWVRDLATVIGALP